MAGGAWRVHAQGGEVLDAEASALRALPPFPRLGVSIAFLKRLATDFADELDGKTTAQACAQVCDAAARVTSCHGIETCSLKS